MSSARARRGSAWLTFVLALGLPSATRAEDPAPDSAGAPAPTTEDPSRPLVELPEPRSIALPDPDRADSQALDALLERITDPEPLVRERAVRELLEVKPRWVAALHVRLDRLADRADKLAMKRTLEAIRDARRRNRDAAADAERAPGSPLLDEAVERAEPQSEAWRNLAHALAMSRMLRHIGNTAAARSLVHVYVRFGEFMRVNTQLELEAMGDRSLAALIEARRHPAQKIAQWAERQLDLRGKAIVGEALRTEDQEALADVLRAYGRIRDPDAARVILGFAQSERAQLRNAAREAVVLLGEVATWQLRDAYENTVGKRAAREWSWQRTARELFTELDRIRQAQEYELFEIGRQAHQAGRLDEMLEKYDRVLAFNPMFERRDEMSTGYLDYARKYGDEHPDKAVSALRRAERIAASEGERKALRSLRHTFEARQLLDAGIADQGLIHQALALDPKNRLADKTLEAALDDGTIQVHPTARYWGAGVIAGISMLGAGGILWMASRRRRAQRSAAPNDPDPAAPDAAQPPSTSSDDPGIDDVDAQASDSEAVQAERPDQAEDTPEEEDRSPGDESASTTDEPQS